MNLPQALAAQRAEQAPAKILGFDPVVHQARAHELAQRETFKVSRYFHDCLPGCKPTLNPKDHIPLEGNDAPTCRMLYRKHLRFMAAGAEHEQRVFLAANRIGKTECAAFEVRCHMTGIYPKWWQGRKFDRPVNAWAAGDTRQTTRDIIQNSLMGPHTGVPTSTWTGMLDPNRIASVVRASGGVANCLDTVYVESVHKHHGAPMLSELGFKSYDQGRRVFQGTEKHLIWLDEEPPDGAEQQEAQAQGSSDIWTECLLRTMTTNGLLLATFTPLRGYTPFLKDYVEKAVMPGTEDEGEDVDAKSHFYPDILDGDAA